MRGWRVPHPAAFALGLLGSFGAYAAAGPSILRYLIERRFRR